MTSIEKLQNHTSPYLENAKFLQAGFMKMAVPPGTDDINAAMLEQGALEVLCAMITLGSAAEKSFSRRRLKQFIAAGKRVAAAKAKSVPKTNGGAWSMPDTCPECGQSAFSTPDRFCATCNSNYRGAAE